MDSEATAKRHLYALLATGWDTQAAQPAADVPWDDVTDLACRSDVASFLYKALGTQRQAIPESTLRRLRLAYYKVAGQNVGRLGDLGRVLAALAAVAGPTLLVKGGALLETLYGNAALRAMGDFDLVVHPHEVPACRKALLGLGFNPGAVEEAPGIALAYRSHEAFLHPLPYGAHIELHWHLLDLPHYIRRVPMDWFWEHSQPSEVGGQRVRVLGPEANLLYLPAHLALHHRFHGLRWYLDLALLIDTHAESLDWDCIAETAQAFDLLLVLRETLQRLHAVWPSLPLAHVLEKLAGCTPTSTERRLFRLMTAEPRTRLLDFYSDLVCMPDLSARARFVFRNTFPQLEYMRKRYRLRREWMVPFWYFYRLADGAHKAVRTLAQVRRLERRPQ